MIYTIGHSNHPIERFVSLLRQHGISAVADVRSNPYSRFHPQFRREPLIRCLAESAIEYLFLGEELGARTRDSQCYDPDGRVSYARLAQTGAFGRGLTRLLIATQTQRVALMCAEKEPLECHRTLLVARALERSGIEVAHILADGGLEGHARCMERLALRLRLDGGLFADPDQIREEAYDVQGRRIAYVKKQ